MTPLPPSPIAAPKVAGRPRDTPRPGPEDPEEFARLLARVGGASEEETRAGASTPADGDGPSAPADPDDQPDASAAATVWAGRPVGLDAAASDDASSRRTPGAAAGVATGDPVPVTIERTDLSPGEMADAATATVVPADNAGTDAAAALAAAAGAHATTAASTPTGDPAGAAASAETGTPAGTGTGIDSSPDPDAVGPDVSSVATRPSGSADAAAAAIADGPDLPTADSPDLPTADGPDLPTAVDRPPRTADVVAPGQLQSTPLVQTGPPVQTVHAPGAPAAGPPATPPTTPAGQLASAIGNLRRLEEGAYSLSLELHPSELGRVHVDVEMRAGVLNLMVAADQGSTRTLLSQQLQDLRSQLEQAGLQAGSMDVSQHSAQDQAERSAQDRQSRDGRGRSATSPTDDDLATPVAVRTPRQYRTDSAVDLRV